LRLSGLRDELTLVVLSRVEVSLLELSFDESSEELSFDELSFDDPSDLDLSSFFESFPPSELGAEDFFA